MAVAVTPPENILEFDSLARNIRDTFKTFPDKRTGKNTQYRLEDAALSAFSKRRSHKAQAVMRHEIPRKRPQCR